MIRVPCRPVRHSLGEGGSFTRRRVSVMIILMP
jgi:hypothetical protein